MEIIFKRSISGINPDKTKYSYGKGMIKTCTPEEVKRFMDVSIPYDDYVSEKKQEARSKVKEKPTKKITKNK